MDEEHLEERYLYFGWHKVGMRVRLGNLGRIFCYEHLRNPSSNPEPIV